MIDDQWKIYFQWHSIKIVAFTFIFNSTAKKCCSWVIWPLKCIYNAFHCTAGCVVHLDGVWMRCCSGLTSALSTLGLNVFSNQYAAASSQTTITSPCQHTHTLLIYLPLYAIYSSLFNIATCLFRLLEEVLNGEVTFSSKFTDVYLS